MIGPVINGNYTAVLNAGLGLGTMHPANTTLSQTGLVPNGSQTLLFEALVPGGVQRTSFDVTPGGQSLAVVILSTTDNYALYGADIHDWSGQTAELAFTLFSETPHTNNHYLYLDGIQFWTQQIPEPGVFGLSSIGALAFGYIALSRHRKPTFVAKDQ